MGGPALTSSIASQRHAGPPSISHRNAYDRVWRTITLQCPIPCLRCHGCNGSKTVRAMEHSLCSCDNWMSVLRYKHGRKRATSEGKLKALGRTFRMNEPFKNSEKNS